MRPGRTQTDMNFYQYEIFAIVYKKPGRNAWCLVSEQNDMFCQVNINLTQKHTGLKVCTQSEICCHLHENGTNSDRYENFSSRSVTETKSDRSAFIVRPVSCKRVKEMYEGRYELMPV